MNLPNFTLHIEYATELLLLTKSLNNFNKLLKTFINSQQLSTTSINFNKLFETSINSQKLSSTSNNFKTSQLVDKILLRSITSIRFDYKFD